MAQQEFAVVTGASSGIGLELARLFAADGYDLVVAADEPRIAVTAEELAAYGTHVEPIQVDLRAAQDVEKLYDVISDGSRVPDAVAFNAGIGRAGRFVDDLGQRDLEIVDVNVRSTVQLAKLVLRDMADRDRGRVLFTSSLVAMMPGSHQTMYNASKAFIQSFSEGLHDEFRGTGVSVTALRGDQKIVASSVSSKLMGVAGRVLPDSVKAVANRLIVTPFDDRRRERKS